jgi:phage regulator Rha-like protein
MQNTSEINSTINAPIEIFFVGDTPRVDSRIIAQRLDIQHKNLMETIGKYIEKFHILGELPFETEVGYRKQGGGNPQKFALLNEDQSIFALTLSRNTPEVVQLKLDLTVAFRNARQSQQQATRQAALPMLDYARVNKELMDIFGIAGNMQTIALNNALKKQFDYDALGTWGMTHLIAEKQEQLLTVSEIAIKLGVKRNAVNPILINSGLQTSDRDHKNNIKYSLTDTGLKHGLYLDTGKKRSDGTPVRQIKWYSSVIDLLKGYLDGSTIMETKALE